MIIHHSGTNEKILSRKKFIFGGKIVKIDMNPAYLPCLEDSYISLKTFRS